MSSIETIKEKSKFYFLNKIDKTFIAIYGSNENETQQVGYTVAWDSKKNDFDYSYGNTYMMNEYVDRCIDDKNFDLTFSFDDALIFIKSFTLKLSN